MTATQTNELCRITVVTPTSFADVAVPTGTSVAELVRAMIVQSDDKELSAVPMVLQRLGGAPFPSDATLDSAQIRDGEKLYLQPRASQVASMVFDDLIDGVGDTIAGRSDGWSEASTSLLFTSLAAGVLAFGVLVLLWAGPVSSVTAAGAGIGVVLMVAAALCAAIFDMKPSARVAGGFGVIYATVAGVSIPLSSGDAPVVESSLPRGWVVQSDTVIAGSVTLALASLFALVAVGASHEAFSAAATIGVGGATIGMLGGWMNWDPVDAIATVAVSVVLAAPALPGFSYRLAHIRPPHLPTDPTDLTADIVDPVPSSEVVPKAAVAHQILTGLLVGSSVVVGLSFPAVASAPGKAPVVLSMVIVAVLLLRSRVLIGRWQRVGVIAAAFVGIAALGWRLLDVGGEEPPVTAAAVAVFLFSTSLFVAASKMPGFRLSPYWGRAADVFESLLAVAVLPVLFSLLGVYATARDIAG